MNSCSFTKLQTMIKRSALLFLLLGICKATTDRSLLKLADLRERHRKLLLQVRTTELQQQKANQEELCGLQEANEKLKTELGDAKAQVERLLFDAEAVGALKADNEKLQSVLDMTTQQLTQAESENSNLKEFHSKEIAELKNDNAYLAQKFEERLQAALKERSKELAAKHKAAMQEAVDRTKSKYNKILKQNVAEHEELMELERQKREEAVEEEKSKLRKLAKIIKKQQQT